MMPPPLLTGFGMFSGLLLARHGSIVLPGPFVPSGSPPLAHARRTSIFHPERYHESRKIQHSAALPRQLRYAPREGDHPHICSLDSCITNEECAEAWLLGATG